MAFIAGEVYSGYRKGQIGIAVDGDNQKALQMWSEILEKVMGKTYNTMEELAQDFIVEQHDDEPDSFHIIIFAEKPLTNRPSYKNNHKLAPKLDRNELPSFEIKSKEGIQFCVPSVHKNDEKKGIAGVHRYSIVGIFRGSVTLNKQQIDMLEKLIMESCKFIVEEPEDEAKLGSLCKQ
jgi:hypothetical protein